jgi:hypothetical protein
MARDARGRMSVLGPGFAWTREPSKPRICNNRNMQNTIENMQNMLNMQNTTENMQNMLYMQNMQNNMFKICNKYANKYAEYKRNM